MKTRTLERFAQVISLAQAIFVFISFVTIAVGALNGGGGFYLFVAIISIPALICLDAGTFLSIPAVERRRNHCWYPPLKWIHGYLPSRVIILISLVVTILWLIAAIAIIVLAYVWVSSIEYGFPLSEATAVLITITFLLFLAQLIILICITRQNKEQIPIHNTSDHDPGQGRGTSQVWNSGSGRIFGGGDDRIEAVGHLSAPSADGSNPQENGVENNTSERPDIRIIEEDEEMALEREDVVPEWERVPMDATVPSNNRVSWGGESIATAPPLYSRPPSYVSEAPSPHRGSQTPIPPLYHVGGPFLGSAQSPAHPTHLPNETSVAGDVGASPVSRGQRWRSQRNELSSNQRP
ncbi:MAG: hypothetical protein MMC33_005235 [Icmadophila ericetorum]|nr:hypothetical protein [Icmadophila ericetorum]